jgi:fibronectin-binding autotransporter adhesin
MINKIGRNHSNFFVICSGRLTKWKGITASVAPMVGVAIWLVGFAPSDAHAADECGVDPAGATILNCAAANYPTGIVYTNSDGLTLNLDNVATTVPTVGVSVTSSAANTNNIVVNATNFTSVTTSANSQNGLSAVNAGTAGNATVTQAAGTVTTSGVSAIGLNSRINNSTNTGTALAEILGGNIVTTGVNATGIVAQSAGRGDTIARVSGGASTAIYQMVC